MGSALREEAIDRRGLAYGKIREGWDKLAREHLGINWTLDTAETRAAEERVADALERYVTGEGEMAGLRAAFASWREAHIQKGEARQQQQQPTLFAVMSRQQDAHDDQN